MRWKRIGSIKAGYFSSLFKFFCFLNILMVYTVFSDLLLQALDERDHLVPLAFGDVELRQGRARMAEEHLPVALADAHAAVRERHVAAAIVHRPARARAEEVDQELLLAGDAVVPAVRPEAAELWIGPEPGQQIVRHRTDRVVAAKT